MAKFIYLYRGPTPDLTPEQGAERMAAFTAWMESSDRRSPTAAARSGRARRFAMTAPKQPPAS